MPSTTDISRIGTFIAIDIGIVSLQSEWRVVGMSRGEVGDVMGMSRGEVGDVTW